VPAGPSSYQLGNVGTGATVLVGEHLFNITLNVTDVAAATELLRSIRESGKAAYHGPLLRRLDPVVLVNRAVSIDEIAAFFADEGVSVLYVHGMPGVGKSTLVRGAIELRRSETPAVWIGCQNLDPDYLLTEICAGMGIDTGLALGDAHARLATRIASVLGAIVTPGILVLDGFEALLDEKGDLASDPLAEAMEALATLEHKLKVLVTTRQIPNGIGAGSTGIRIVHLGGLSAPMAEQLLRTRMHRGPQSPAAIPRELLEKLGGNPKFIELVASVASELPIERLTAGLLAASDIGNFVLGEVFARTNPEELQVLRAALVFRDVFTFDALKAVHDAIDTQHPDIESAVRTLVRRAVFDTIAEPRLAYYLHPILRDAVQRDTEQEADAHAAAALWWGQTPFVAGDVTTWDDLLYHLRRAAEIARDGNHLEAYAAWLVEYLTALDYAGWTRRVVAELRVLAQLTNGTEWAETVQYGLGKFLYVLGEHDEAIAVLDKLAKGPEGQTEEGAYIKLTLGRALVEADRIDDALRLADELEPVVNASGDIGDKLEHRDLRFSIARRTENAPDMMRWAKETLDLAEAQDAESPSPGSRNRVAEAHFALAMANLRTGDLRAMLAHLADQLRIKLEIGKIGGAANALFNLAVAIEPLDPARSAPLCLTADQITYERQLPKLDFPETSVEKAAAQLIADANKREAGRTQLAGLSADLLPFYERALKRWEGMSSAA
jgi:tetratricopeptide (TPR) repeat protein